MIDIIHRVNHVNELQKIPPTMGLKLILGVVIIN